MSHLQQWSVYLVSSSNCGPQIVCGCSEEPQLSRQHPRQYTVHSIFSCNILQQIYPLLDGMKSRLFAGWPNSRVSVPAREKRFFSSSESPDRLQAPLPQYSTHLILLSGKAGGSWCWVVAATENNLQFPKYPHGVVRITVHRNNLTLPFLVNFCKNQKRGNEEMDVLLGPAHLFGLITVLRFLGNCRRSMWQPINHNVHRSNNSS
jgi:hypothetical protein